VAEAFLKKPAMVAGFFFVPKTARRGSQMAGRRTRDGSLLIIAALWLVGFIAIVAFQPSGPPVTVVHWANGHMTRPGLLPQMAERFNAANHRTANGQRIAVRVFNDGSAEQVSDLVSRVVRGTPLDAKLPDPVVVTPSADHWLVDVNDAAGKQVVDLTTTKSIAYTWIGIVTYREMAECLGWPNRDIGYADIIALRDDPSGWAAYPCAKAEWGQRPLLGFTDPATSSTGRSALFTLYSIAANKAPDQLTVADVSAAAAIQYVKVFQRVVDHYLPGTIPLNTKIHLGPHYGHFFLMPEDDLVHLYMGTERQWSTGSKSRRRRSRGRWSCSIPKRVRPPTTTPGPWSRRPGSRLNARRPRSSGSIFSTRTKSRPPLWHRASDHLPPCRLRSRSAAGSVWTQQNRPPR